MPINSENYYLKSFYILLFFILLFFIVEWLDLRDDFSIDKLRMTIQQNSITGFLVFTLLFVLGNFIQIPGLVFLAAAVITLGKTYGGIVIYSVAVISCIISFATIRFMGGNILRNLKYQWANKIFNKLDSKPITSVFILRSVFQTLPILNYGMALSGVSFRNHLIGTLLALPLPLFLYCLFFDELANYFQL